MKKIESQMKKISPKDVCSMLSLKFEVERMERFFDIAPDFHFTSNEFELNPQNSMLLRFKGIKNENPYKMLLILEFCERTEVPIPLQNQIRRVAEKNIDKIVIWLKKNIDADTIHALKTSNSNIIYISNSEINSVNYISNFYPYGEDYNFAVILNKLTDLLVVRLKKLFHLVLSEIAAPSYDTSYGRSKIGTKAIMDFEEEILHRTIKYLKWQKKSKEQKLETAIDVGCGTGRHSIVCLAPYFKSVFGFDFSPKMIEVAKFKKREQDLDHIVFTTADLEYEQITYENEFIKNSDLVVASFGMGSFIEDTAKMLRRFHEWMIPGGMLFLSFYNRNSILLNLVPSWRETSLSAHIDVDSNTLLVQLTPDTVFQIYCKPFDDTIKAEIAKKFDILNIYHFPTTMALMPNSLLQDPIAKNLFEYVDKNLCSNKEHFLGHYVIVVAQKSQDSKIDGYKKVISILKERQIKHEIIEHDMVLSVNDVIKEIGAQSGFMVKTLVFCNNEKKRYLVVALPHTKKLNKIKFSKMLEIHHKKLKFATEKEIVALGFPLGGIPPFGFPEKIDIDYYIEKSLKEAKDSDIYMGVGDNKKTLKLRSREFVKLVQNYIPINC